MQERITDNPILIWIRQIKILRIFLLVVGISLIVWSFVDSRFRDSEGFLKGTFCFAIITGMAFFILGYGIKGRFKKFIFWFVLALIGQAAALQLIEAGPSIRYQHYKAINQILTNTHPIILSFFILQVFAVIYGLGTHWSIIQNWIGRNFKCLQFLCISVAFVLVSATVSSDKKKYVIELIFAAFVQAVNLINIILVVWAIPEDVLASLKQKFDMFLSQSDEENRKFVNIDRFVIFASIWVIILASLLNVFSYQRHPHIPDEVMYLYQARYFADGNLSVPAPAVPEAFSFYLIPHESQRWYSIFPPGWPLVLSLGVLLGVPWLVNPILAGLTILLCYIFVQEIADRSKARIVVILLCFSPWYVFMSMNFMSHTFTLTCALTAALFIAKARKSGKAIWGWLGGASAGLVSLIRPLDGVIVAGLLGLWMIGIGGRRLKLSSIIGFIFGTIIIGSTIFAYNKQITGQSTTFPLTAYYEQYYGHKSNALGFGPERGLGWAIDPFPGHSPFEALINANLNTFSINIELFGWSTGSLFLIVFLLFSKDKRRCDYLMFIIIFTIAAIYSLYWFSGGPDFGARYWYLMIVPLIGLTVRGIQVLQEKLVSSPNSDFSSIRLFMVIISLSLMSFLNFLPWRAIDKYHHYRSMRPDIRYLEKEYHFGKSLILIQGDYPDYQSAWVFNPLNPNADAPVYAWDKSPDIRAKLLDAYPDRPIWIINGPSVTKAGYKVVRGPLSKQELEDMKIVPDHNM